MTYLDVRTGLTLIERALVEALSLAYQQRHPAVADLTALTALQSFARNNTIPDRSLRFVQSEGVVYRWLPYSTNAQALPYVVLPSDRGARPGRWERCQSSVTKGPNHFAPVHRVAVGYARAVKLYENEAGDEAALERIAGRLPAYLIRWKEDEVGGRKTAGPYGALYSYDLDFEIWCLSRNYRDADEALQGSEIASEELADPGLNRMIGDVRYLLGSGANLGLGPGVAQCRINGSARIIEEDLTSRYFVAEVPIKIQASFSIPDEDLVPLSEVWIQFEDAGLKSGSSVDLQNYVALGGRIGTGAGLVAGMDPTVAYVGGSLVSIVPGPHLFTAATDTYRDLAADGTLTYAEVANGADPPPQASGTLRLGVTVTDGSNVIGDALLCGYAIPVGEPFEAV